MEQLLQAAERAGYGDILACLERILRDLKIENFSKLEDLPGLLNGRTRICGPHDIYKFISDVKQALLDTISESQPVGTVDLDLSRYPADEEE